MGIVKSTTGGYALGFVLMAAVALICLLEPPFTPGRIRRRPLPRARSLGRRAARPRRAQTQKGRTAAGLLVGSTGWDADRPLRPGVDRGRRGSRRKLLGLVLERVRVRLGSAARGRRLDLGPVPLARLDRDPSRERPLVTDSPGNRRGRPADTLGSCRAETVVVPAGVAALVLTDCRRAPVSAAQCSGAKTPSAGKQSDGRTLRPGPTSHLAGARCGTGLLGLSRVGA